MNSRMKLVVAALMIGITAIAVNADGQISHQAGAFASYWDTEGADGAYGAGLKYSLTCHEFAQRWECGVDVRASWLVLDAEGPGGVDDLNIIPVEVTALARYSVIDGMKLYGGIGLGYYFFEEEDSVEYSKVEGDTGYHLAFGVQQEVAERVSLFLEARYTWLEATIEGAPADNDELDLSGASASFGVSVAL